MVLGQYLKAIRKARKLSLKDVRTLSGITDSKLSRIENGTNTSDPEPSDLYTLANVYGVNPVEMYLVAGYLDEKALSSYKQVFSNVNLLTEEEKNHIQKSIDLFTKGRKKDDF